MLRSGEALAKAETWFAAQGATAMDPPIERLIETPIASSADGYISRIDAGAVGELVLDLGGGRRQKDDHRQQNVTTSLLHTPLRPKAVCPILCARQVAGSFLEPAGSRVFRRRWKLTEKTV